MTSPFKVVLQVAPDFILDEGEGASCRCRAPLRQSVNARRAEISGQMAPSYPFFEAAALRETQWPEAGFLVTVRFG